MQTHEPVEHGQLFRPLAPDYWPPEIRHPYWRAFLSIIIAPICVAAAISLFAGGVVWLQAGLSSPLEYAVETFFLVIHGFFSLSFTPLLVALFVLWSLRLRRRGAFLLFGVICGLLSAVLNAEVIFEISARMLFAMIALNLALIFLIRWGAGVWSLPSGDVPEVIPTR
jgi:hypothetical protein